MPGGEAGSERGGMAGGLRLLLPLLLASLAAGAAIGGSAEAPSRRAEPGEGGPRAVGAPWAGGGRRAAPALPRQVRGQPPPLRPAACSSPLSGFSRKSGDSRCRRGELPPSGAAPVPASPGVRGGLVRQRRRLRGRPASCSPSKASSPPEGHGRSPVSHTGGGTASGGYPALYPLTHAASRGGWARESSTAAGHPCSPTWGLGRA